MKDDVEAPFKSLSNLIYYDLKGFADSSPPLLNIDEFSKAENRHSMDELVVYQ